MVVVAVGSDPNPNEYRAIAHGKGAVPEPDTGRPIRSNPLESQRRMLRIRLEEFEVFSVDVFCRFRQLLEMFPKTRRRSMRQLKVRQLASPLRFSGP